MNQSQIDIVRRLVTKNDKAVDNLTGAYPDWYIKQMTELGEKYREIRWLPLDIPRIEFDDYNEFLDFWDKESIDVVRLKPCTAEPWTKEAHPLGKMSNYYVPQFKGMHFYTMDPDKFNENEAGIFARKYKTHPMFNRIIEQVHDLYPFFNVTNLYIWESVKEVLPHRDQTMFWQCPTEFRAMLHDENTEPTLYISDIEHGDSHFVDMDGMDTNAFCWSNGTQVHGSDYHGKRKQLLCINGVLSVSKTDALLERSVAKYKDQLNYKLNM
jgi:hypothetical protein